MSTKLVAMVYPLFLLLTASGAQAAGQHKGNGEKSQSGWWKRAERIHAIQPHWITPVVTTTPLLVEEFRFDASRADVAGNAATVSFFNGKGLELIPTEHTEVIAGVPGYFSSGAAGARSSWGDFPMLLKYRIRSAPAREGNYVLSLFLGATFPTGTNGHSAGKVVLSPAMAFGKGWGDFDVQGTFGTAVPAGTWERLGTPFLLNMAFQYRVLERFWPEVEVNTTAWPNGADSGKKETFLTPGIVVGRIPLRGRVGLVVGTGVQIAATHFHRSNHNLILTVRFPF